MKLYARAGYRVAYVERSVTVQIPGSPFKFVRKFDAFEMFDFLAFKVGKPGMLGINACAVSHIGEHVRKFRVLSVAHDWLNHQEGNKIVVLGWARPKSRGGEPVMRCRQLRKADCEMREGDFCDWVARKVRQKRAKRQSDCNTDRGGGGPLLPGFGLRRPTALEGPQDGAGEADGLVDHAVRPGMVAAEDCPALPLRPHRRPRRNAAP